MRLKLSGGSHLAAPVTTTRLSGSCSETGRWKSAWTNLVGSVVTYGAMPLGTVKTTGTASSAREPRTEAQMCSRDTCPSRQINAADDDSGRRAAPRMSAAICDCSLVVAVHPPALVRVKHQAVCQAGWRRQRPDDDSDAPPRRKILAGGGQ